MLWKLAGAVGVHPGPWKLGQLQAAFEGRDQREWTRTAEICFTVANSVPRRTTIPRSRFNPYSLPDNAILASERSIERVGLFWMAATKEKAKRHASTN